MNPSNTWASLKSLSEKYGEIFQITVLGQTIVFVAGAALATELCDQRRFRKYVGGPIVEIRYAVHDALFTAFDNEPSWGIAHRICAPRLSTDAVREWAPEVVECCEEMLAKWKGMTMQTQGGGFELMGELNRLNLEATTATLFGTRLGCITAEKDHPMLAAMEDATSEAMKRPTRPGLLNWLLHGRKFKSATNVMREVYAAPLVKARHQGQGAGRKDLLTALMEGMDPETGKRLTDSEVIDEIVSMPIGSSTAPCAIAAAVYFLCRNPRCLEKARRELDGVLGAWKGEEGSVRIGVEHLRGTLGYVECIVRETLRLSFAAPGFNIEPIPRANRKDTSPVLLGGGKYAVKHDQAMIIVLAGVNRDPTVFTEPLAFRPERWEEGSLEDKSLPDGVRKWFGNGKRECIGKHWAWQFMVLVVSMLIREVDFEMVDEGYEMRQDGWFNVRPVGFEVRARVRRT